jgi:DNA-binding transcriptional regulator GbsR (MarR family)
MDKKEKLNKLVERVKEDIAMLKEQIEDDKREIQGLENYPKEYKQWRKDQKNFVRWMNRKIFKLKVRYIKLLLFNVE